MPTYGLEKGSLWIIESCGYFDYAWRSICSNYTHILAVGPRGSGGSRAIQSYLWFKQRVGGRGDNQREERIIEEQPSWKCSCTVDQSKKWWGWLMYVCMYVLTLLYSHTDTQLFWHQLVLKKEPLSILITWGLFLGLEHSRAALIPCTVSFTVFISL